MDQIDKQILAQLQVNAAQPVADIARKVGLSVTPCWRRIQRMEETGLIRKRVAVLDPQKIGVGMSVFVAVRTDQHNAEWHLTHILDQEVLIQMALGFLTLKTILIKFLTGLLILQKK